MMLDQASHSLQWPIYVGRCFLDHYANDRVAWRCMRSVRAARSNTRKVSNRTVSRMVNNVRALREEQLLTKAELARKAGISPLTLARIESGHPCRVDTKRKIILALGLKPTDKDRVFGVGGSHGVRKGR